MEGSVNMVPGLAIREVEIECAKAYQEYSIACLGSPDRIPGMSER